LFAGKSVLSLLLLDSWIAARVAQLFAEIHLDNLVDPLGRLAGAVDTGASDSVDYGRIFFRI
jgi:hypothetical protein